MNKTLVLMYMNQTLSRRGGAAFDFTQNDAKMMSMLFGAKYHHYVAPEALMMAKTISNPQMVTFYRNRMWHTLIDDYNLEVVINNHGLIIQYK